MRRFVTLGIHGTAFLLGLTACQTSSAGEVIEQSTDSLDVVNNESALVSASTDGMTAAMAPSDAAVHASSTATTFFRPAGCVTATAAGATVTYVLSDCTGPYGLVHVTGTFDVQYSLHAGGGLDYHATGTGVSINGATMSMDSTGTYSVAGTTQTLTAQTSGRGTGPRGHSFMRTGVYTMSWDGTTSCFALDGHWSTVGESMTVNSSVTGFRKCAVACPAAGGVLAAQGPHDTVTMSFDGTDRAAWTADRYHGTVGLFCIGTTPPA